MPRELVDVLEPAQEAAIDDRELLGGGRRVRAENLVRRGLQDLGEADQQRAMQAQVAALVLGDQRRMNVEPLRELDLGEAAALANRLEALAEARVVGVGRDRWRRRRGGLFLGHGLMIGGLDQNY